MVNLYEIVWELHSRIRSIRSKKSYLLRWRRLHQETNFRRFRHPQARTLSIEDRWPRIHWTILWRASSLITHQCRFRQCLRLEKALIFVGQTSRTRTLYWCQLICKGWDTNGFLVSWMDMGWKGRRSQARWRKISSLLLKKSLSEFSSHDVTVMGKKLLLWLYPLKKKESLIVIRTSSTESRTKSRIKWSNRHSDRQTSIWETRCSIRGCLEPLPAHW